MSLAPTLSAYTVFANKDLREPEVHIVGEILGASDLESDNAFCVFQVKTGKYWSCVGGEEEGQTQTDYPEGEDEMVQWNHPLDLHYYTKTLEGWPKIIFEVWKLDSFGSKSLSGYSFINVPTTPGSHEIEALIWRPCGTQREEMAEFFLGESARLVNASMIHSGLKAKEDRHRITTKTVGKVHVRLDVLLRHVQDHHVET